MPQLLFELIQQQLHSDMNNVYGLRVTKSIFVACCRTNDTFVFINFQLNFCFAQ